MTEPIGASDRSVTAHRIPSGMIVTDLICAIAEDTPVGVVLTDAQVDSPGPVILYANSAFARMVGRDLGDIACYDGCYAH